MGFELPSAINKNLPSSIDIVIKKAVATKPDDRYADAKELSDALDKIATGAKRLKEKEIQDEARKLGVEQKKSAEEERKEAEEQNKKAQSEIAEMQRQEGLKRKEEERSRQLEPTEIKKKDEHEVDASAMKKKAIGIVLALLVIIAAVFAFQKYYAAVPVKANISIVKGLMAEGINQAQQPITIGASLSPGNKTLYYYVSYNGAVPDSTAFTYKWSKDGTLIKEDRLMLKYASGNVWNSLNYDFQPGDYDVSLYLGDSLTHRVFFSIKASDNPTLTGDAGVMEKKADKKKKRDDPRDLASTSLPKKTRSGVLVKASGLGEDIVNNRPVGIATRFQTGSKVIFYAEISDAKPGQSKILTRFLKNGVGTSNCGPSPVNNRSAIYVCRSRPNLANGNYEVRFSVDDELVQILKFKVGL
jgi:hypothetical protein